MLTGNRLVRLTGTNDTCGNTGDDGTGRHGTRNHRACGDNTMVTDLYTVQNGDLGADPAILANANAFAYNALHANRPIGVDGDMIFRVTTEILSDDAIVADFQPAASAEVCEFTDAHILTDPDVRSELIERGGDHHPTEGSDAAMVADDQFPGAGCAQLNMVAKLYPTSKSDVRRIEKRDSAPKQYMPWHFRQQQQM